MGTGGRINCSIGLMGTMSTGVCMGTAVFGSLRQSLRPQLTVRYQLGPCWPGDLSAPGQLIMSL